MKELRELYQTHLHDIHAVINQFPDTTLEGPLLIEPIAYHQQSVKLLIIGQETGGWHCNYEDIDEQLSQYRKFNQGEFAIGPFWHITRKVEAAVGVQPCCCAWTNLNRFDQEGKPPEGLVLDAMSALDFLIRDEIRLLKPDICIFYTNRKYDHRLAALYSELQISDIEGLPSGHFSRLAHPELPTLSFRTPHPKTMRIRYWEEDFVEYLTRLRAIPAPTTVPA